jgi:hypothetical protein
MFSSTRQNPGLGALFAVALVIATALSVAGVGVKTYVDAGAGQAPAAGACRVVCRPGVVDQSNG